MYLSVKLSMNRKTNPTVPGPDERYSSDEVNIM